MALEKIREVRGTGVYIPGNDLDTDRIIPARFMKCVTFDGLGEYMFYDVRFNEDGSPKNHVLNEAHFQDASIMIADSNFGCGSSREHAPQAIRRYGFRAVIAESFAEIFYGNSVTLGMPCVEAQADDIRRLAAAIKTDPGTKIRIDVESETVSFGDDSFQAVIKPGAKSALLEGRWDPIGELLEGDAAIAQTAAHLPYVEV